MKKGIAISWTLSVALAAGCAGSSGASKGADASASSEDETGEGEMPIEMHKVPSVVLKAAYDACAGLDATEASVETENGVVYYEVKGMVHGGRVEVVVSAEGHVLAVEASVVLDKVPANVKEAAVAKVPGFVPDRAERISNKDGIFWELRGTAAGKVHEIKVSDAGQVVEAE
jgi:uncharacterized membrane protein YkoI